MSLSDDLVRWATFGRSARSSLFLRNAMGTSFAPYGLTKTDQENPDFRQLKKDAENISSSFKFYFGVDQDGELSPWLQYSVESEGVKSLKQVKLFEMPDTEIPNPSEENQIFLPIGVESPAESKDANKNIRELYRRRSNLLSYLFTRENPPRLQYSREFLLIRLHQNEPDKELIKFRERISAADAIRFWFGYWNPPLLLDAAGYYPLLNIYLEILIPGAKRSSVPTSGLDTNNSEPIVYTYNVSNPCPPSCGGGGGGGSVGGNGNGRGQKP